MLLPLSYDTVNCNYRDLGRIAFRSFRLSQASIPNIVREVQTTTVTNLPNTRSRPRPLGFSHELVNLQADLRSRSKIFRVLNLRIGQASLTAVVLDVTA